MEEFPEIIHRLEARQLLRAIKEKGITQFKPSFNYERGIFYPEVEEIIPNFTASLNLLEELEKNEIVRREYFDSVLICPSCGSHRIFMKVKCPVCGSRNIEKGSVIEHLHCGHLDFEEKFVEGEKLICPKCGKELKVLGVDYRRPGIFFKCCECGQIRSIPKYEFLCVDCKSSFEEDLLDIKKVFTFKVEPKGLMFIERYMINFEELIKALDDLGYFAEPNVKLKGRSGVTHSFDLAVWKLKTKSLEYVVDVEIRRDEIEEFKVFSLFAKAMDVRAKEKILIAIPNLTKRARDLAKSYNILTLENLESSNISSAVLDVIKSKESLV